MLDETEKKGCVKILELLSYDNLVSLTDTVTGRVVTVENKEEALHAIMIYTRNGEELLRRRKVRREHLYQYLAEEGQVEHPASDKAQLLKKVLKLWETMKAKGDDLKDGKLTTEVSSIKHEESSQVDSADSSTQVDSADSSTQVDSTEVTESSSQVDSTEVPEQSAQVDSTEVTEPSAQVVTTKPSATVTVKPKLYDGDEGQLLALHFSAWFFQLLESLGKCSPDKENPDWGPQHFWQDAKLTVQCNEPTGTQETTIDGAQLVSEKFLTMIVVDQLCFNPNLSSDSVRGKQNPHGLTLVMVCGTVHRQKQYIGVFEQTFGLIRDPTEENNWKIKFSKLILKASGSGSSNHLEGPA